MPGGVCSPSRLVKALPLPPRLRAQTADRGQGRDEVGSIPARSLAGVTAPSQGLAALAALTSPPQAPGAPVLGGWW